MIRTVNEVSILDIDWPEGLEPTNAPVFSHNELEIAAPPEVVWKHLIHATEWSQWYKNSRNVKLLNTEGENLQEGTEFSWVTFNIPVTTTVKDYIPYEKLSWTGSGLGNAQAFHVWVIEPTSSGCKVITEEVQRGTVPSVMRFFFRRMLHTQHQKWLKGLKELSESDLNK